MDPPPTALRSRIMAAVRSRDTGPEMAVRRALHARGYRYRLHVKDLPGRPDIVLARHSAVVFVHGCFWHGHACTRFSLPATRAGWWAEKIERNRRRDARNARELRERGWRVFVVWECALKGRRARGPDEVAAILASWFGSDSRHDEVTEVA